MHSYCTYFDSGYLDKGLVMLRSLRAHNEAVPLFVLALDECTRAVLESAGPAKLTILTLNQIQTAYPALENLKRQRSRAEFIWTLTPHLLEYLLDNEKLECCTYLDADLWFYDDPDILNRELEEPDCQTLITPHRFPNKPKYRELERRHGKYCVQFNTFGTGSESRRLLSWWKDRVLENCEYNTRKGLGGDQKYLEQFTEMSTDVHELTHQGGGVAPWNLSRYLPDAQAQTIETALPGQPEIILCDSETGLCFPLLFYHFANIKYLNQRLVNISVGQADVRLKNAIYRPYLREVRRTRFELGSTYGIVFSGGRSVSRNYFSAFAQRYLARIRLKDFAVSDLIRF